MSSSMAMHDLALEPRSIEPSATPVQEGGTMDLGSSYRDNKVRIGVTEM